MMIDVTHLSCNQAVELIILNSNEWCPRAGMGSDGLTGTGWGGLRLDVLGQNGLRWATSYNEAMGYNWLGWAATGWDGLVWATSYKRMIGCSGLRWATVGWDGLRWAPRTRCS